MGNTRIDQAARAKALKRRLEMEHDRAARIEHAAAAVLTALAAKRRPSGTSVLPKATLGRACAGCCRKA